MLRKESRTRFDLGLILKRGPRVFLLVYISVWFGGFATPTLAGTIFGFSSPNGLDGGFRWDAAPRTVNILGTDLERSLAGGLRFSVQGGSYQAFRDLFSWQGGPPAIPIFQTAVEGAFNAWTVPDPVTGLTTALSFIADFNTPVVGFNAGAGGLDRRGAEIDLFGANDAGSWDVGDPDRQGEARFGTVNSLVTLTSGTVNYAGSRAIAGADIILNSNSQALYTPDRFRRLLTHEIGHALGLGDVEGDINPGAFIDDNFDGSSSASALATLTNPWALLVDPLNPAASPLSRYTVPFGDPGTTTPGVNILMESRGLGIANGNPLTNLTPLTNDDYGTRQFLYPSFSQIGRVPEPNTFALCFIGLVGFVACRRLSRRSSCCMSVVHRRQ